MSDDDDRRYFGDIRSALADHVTLDHLARLAIIGDQCKNRTCARR
jgi:hypothetical protein